LLLGLGEKALDVLVVVQRLNQTSFPALQVLGGVSNNEKREFLDEL